MSIFTDYASGTYASRKRKGVGKRKHYRPLSGSYHKTSSMRNARAIANLNKRTGGFMGLELKFFDTLAVSRNVASATNLTGGEVTPSIPFCLNAMIPGDGESERLGRHIVMRSIKVKGRIQDPVAEGLGLPPATPHCNVYLILDKQTNGAVFNSEDVFTNIGNVNATINSIFLNMENTDRFQVLDSAHMKLDPMVMVDDTSVPQEFSRAQATASFSLSYRWPKGKKVLFKGTGGTIVNIQDYSLHIVAFSTSGNLNIDYGSRLRYTTS